MPPLILDEASSAKDKANAFRMGILNTMTPSTRGPSTEVISLPPTNARSVCRAISDLQEQTALEYKKHSSEDCYHSPPLYNLYESQLTEQNLVVYHMWLTVVLSYIWALSNSRFVGFGLLNNLEKDCHQSLDTSNEQTLVICLDFQTIENATSNFVCMCGLCI